MNSASRRQRQYERKYSSYRKYTATEDVNYATHTSRSAFRTESITSRSSDRGRSSSSEIISASETRSLPVYIATQDYVPEPDDTESVALEQGQIVEVLDKKNAASWLIRTKARPPKTGWVPGSYFESPTEYYKQRKRTREIVNNDLTLTEEQEAILKRDQVYDDLLRSEEEFVNELRTIIEVYVKALDDANIPEEVKSKKDELAMNLKQLHNFHANIMVKGLQYYSDDPGKVGQTFTRLERDFDLYVQFHCNLPHVKELLKQQTIGEFFQALSDKAEAGSKSYEEHLQNVADRMVQYQNFFKEFVKYTSRAKLNTKTMQKALELTMSVAERTANMFYIKQIEHYPGDLSRIGQLYRHDSFMVWEGDQEAVERYVFLFKNKLMITNKDDSKDPPSYKHIATIRLDKYAIQAVESEPNILEFKSKESGLPEFQIRAKDIHSMEFIRQAWLKDIQQMKKHAVSEQDMETETTSEFDATMSDIRSDFSEYSTTSRSYFGPEEGPPRKKIKSPPVISPTTSTTSLYSGGSSSIDWTTTGTTLDMQGTRVTRTQYGFRTLQESSAKMCLKVTGYPLPEISWYKDDQLLHEDERHTFYCDEDGFFALTIDPVQTEDTGRYTCMATNEYGQASTSAFFRVLKVEKEAAPPAFVATLQDQEVKEGEIVTFECEVEGWPEPELVWLVDEQPLRPSHDFKLEYDGQNAKLEIRDAQPEDTGVYRVRIKNEYGSAEANAKLIVQPDPDKNYVAPEFQATIEDVECNEGDTVKFKSVLTGDPNPEVIWMINGVPLSESDKVKFISEDGICILSITDVSRHFNGTVTCQGINRLGSQSCDANLKVLVPPTPPHFERPLEDKIVQEEQTVVLETEISGFPNPNVSFTIKGKPIMPGQNGIEIVEKGDGCYRIEISKAIIEQHNGEIVCRAFNEHGQAESRARLVVEPIEEESRSAPVFVKDIEDQSVKYGEKAVFETSVSGNPNPEVSWFINGQELDKLSPGVSIEILSPVDHRLILDSAHYSGIVLCRAENLIGRYETKAKLLVLSEEKKRAPQFVEKLTDRSLIEESTGVFEVRVDAEPKANLRWFLGEKEVVKSERVKIREFDGSWKLEISKLEVGESGTIRCIAENSEGTAESLAHLEISKKPQAPQFEDRPKNVTVEKGQTARFQAKASAIPEPIYQWSVNGRKVKETMEGAKVENVNGVSILTIDTFIFDSCTVSVKAENSLGVDEANALLVIETKREIEERREEVMKSEVIEKETTTTRKLENMQIVEDEKHELVKTTTEVKESVIKSVEETHRTIPVITKTLQNRSVKCGELADFEVSIEPNEVSVQWFSNEKLLYDGMPGVTISCQNFDFKLTVDSAQYAGIITFKASNEVGTAEAKANLVAVQEKYVEKPPEFTNVLDDLTVKECDRVEITIESSGKATFEWALNDTILQNGKNNVTIRSEENRSILIFNEVTLQQSGIIKVTATNKGGQASSSFSMTVKEKDIPPEIIRGPNSLTIKEYDTAEFRVEISGKPRPVVKWQLNGEELLGKEENITIKSFEDVHILKIEKANLKQAGEVVVTAENAAGMVGKEVVLKIEPDLRKPVFKTQLIDRIVNEGEPLRWDITIERPYKDVTIRWLLNGKELTNNENVQIMDHGEGKYHMTINESRTEMSGTLVVQATNPRGTSESRASIQIREMAQKPVFLKKPQDHAVEEGQAVKFSATVCGKPTPVVGWYLEETKLETNDEFRVKFDETTGKTSVKILQAKLSDNKKKIMVKAENSEGTTEAFSTLIVDKKSEPPSIVTEMFSRQVNEGATVNFSVAACGCPTPEVAWFHNGKPIVPGENVKITAENGVYTLLLSNVTPEQSGEISCEAKNAVGSRKQFATLTVKAVGEAPVFEKNMEDKLVVEGEEIIMSAKLAEVKPKPLVTWLKDGKQLDDSRFQVYQEEDGTLKLKIDSAQLGDKSRITIRAENQFGLADCSASIGVTKKRPMAKPSFLSEILPITVTEGESLNVKVIITGDPIPFTKWYINDQLVVATEDTEMKVEDGVYSLTIHGCTKDMNGTIKCVAYNKAGEIATQGNLTVMAPIPVEFETSLCDATCREGDTLKLKAVLLGEPMPEVSWFVNGKKLEESQNVMIHAEKGTYTVTIKNITCDYSGKVLCEAVNEYGKASSEATLLVLPRGEPPDFIEWLSNIKARQGSQITHKVIFTGDPKPNLTWYINNEEVKNSDEIKIVTANNISTLTIKSFNCDKHTGEIICKAENDAGEVSCTASMGPYTSDMCSESQTESEAFAEEILNFEEITELATEEESMEELQRTPTPIMAPKFITKIKDTRAARGHQAIFECVVPDTKGVCCKWLKDGREIELVARIRVQTRTVEGCITSELIIDEVVPEDAGKYTVIIENVAGKDSCEATLSVTEVLTKPENRVPEFVVALQDKTCNGAERVVFECKVSGEPQPAITWFHEKIPIVEEAKKTIVESEGNVQRLILISTDITDQGEYKCVAENLEGKAESKATLTVHAEAPQFTRHITSKEVSEGEKIVLNCAVRGTPQPTVQFFRETTRITSDSHHSIEHDASNVHWRMVIEKATKSDFAKYHAVAINSVGMADSEAEIRRKAQKPEFLEVLKNRQVTEGDEIIMEVKFSGIPQPEVKWFKDNKEITENVKKVTIKVEESWSKLFIEEATLEDTGNYRVELINTEGKETSNADVVVKHYAVAPQFTKTLTDLKVEKLEKVEMMVTVTGAPTPEVRWFKDGVPVQIDSKRILIQKGESGQHILTIKNVGLEDAGTYSCTATNKLGTVESKANIAVQEVLERPQFIEKLSELKVTEKEMAEISVTVTGKPQPEMVWVKDGVPLNIDNIHLITKQDEFGHHTLVIKEARVEDSGMYSCKAVNVVGETDLKVELVVAAKTEAPLFTESLKELSVHEKETAQFSVTVVGTPTPEISWYKDGSQLNIDSNHLVEKKDELGHYTLLIKEACVEDVGTYSCKATNLAGTVETQAKFAVISEIVAPSFTEDIGEFEIPEGEKAELTCAVIGKPLPEVKWMKDGAEVHIDNVHILTKSEEGGKQSLVINQVRKEDVGVYSCIATNQAGTDKTIGELKFPKYGFQKVPEEEVKPFFVEALEMHTVNEGETVSMECRVNEEAHANVQWFLGDKLIEPCEHTVVEQLENGIVKLTVQNATKEDIGTYRCEAFNKLGKAATTAELKFASAVMETVKDEFDLIEFVRPLDDVMVAENSTVELQCALGANANSVQVQWSKDGIEVPVQRAVSEQMVDGTQKLKIEKVTSEDAGTYRCTASIGAASVWTEGKLTVSEVAKEIMEDERPPTFIELLKSCTVTENDEAILRCKLQGMPKPTVSWMKDGVKLEKSSHVIIDYHEDGTIVLKIRNVKKEDSGEYRCDATNKYGTAWTTGPIKVVCEGELPTEGEAPDFAEPIKPVTVIVGEKAVLEGKVTGQPKPEVKWYRGENLVKENSRIEIENLSDGIQRLILKNTSVDDTDEYRCLASNQYGDVWSDATLSVQVPSAIEEEATDLVAPTFLKTLQEVNVHEAEQVVLECKFIGEPMPEIRWFKDKHEIKADDVHFIKETLVDGTTRLVINSVTKADAGEFRCEAQNNFGTARTEANLNVLYANEAVMNEISPEFVQELKPVEANEGQQIAFQCRVAGVPVPQVKWFKDGEEMKSNEHVRIESLPDGTNRLTINLVHVEDQGNYRCEATNSAGSMSSKAPLIVNALEILRLKKGLEDMEVQIGSKIRLYVEVEGQPKIVKWFHGKDEVKNTRRTRLETITEQAYSLETDDTERSDEGSYRVVLSSDTDTVESSCMVTVIEGEVPPTFYKGLQDQSVSKGSKLVLEIEVDGKPKQVKWLKAGFPVDANVAQVKVLGDGKYQLIIDEIKESDLGNYVVQVSNSAGMSESKANITLKAEQKPEIVNGLKSATVKAGEKATFEVEIRGPVKQIKWYKNGVELKDVETIKIDDVKYQFNIEKASKNDEAEYKVVLSNDGGEAESIAKLTVTLPVIEFTKSLKDQTVNAGTSANLSIEVNSPPRQVKWYQNGKEITKLDKVKAKKISDTVYELEILDVGKEMAGDYKVVVSNAESQESQSTCKLTVKLPSLEFTKTLEDQIIDCGTNAVLSIKLNSKPETVTWYKNNQKISITSKVKPEKTSDTSYQLNILDADKDASGNYKIVVSNEESSAESSCTLKVNLPVLQIIENLADQTADKGEKVLLTVRVNTPPKQIKWYKNNEEIKSSDKAKPKKVNDCTYQLEISDVIQDDTAEYKVVLSTDDETVSSSCVLNVKAPSSLVIIEGLKDQEVNVGDKVVLSLEVSSAPKSIRWYKNGKEITSNDKCKLKKIDDTKYQLEIPDVSKDFGGEYKVLLTTEENDVVDSSCILSVRLPTLIIIKGLEDQETQEGDMVQLSVEVNTPPKSVKWYKDGKEISPTDKAKLEKVGDKVYKLQIPNASKDDTAEYKVILATDDDTVDSSCCLTVKLPKLVITKSLEDQTINPGEKVLLGVAVNTAPKSVKWYKNGKEIGSNAKAKPKKIDVNNYQLEIPNAAKDDAADYKVELSNDAGSVDSVCKLKVRKLIEKPTIEKGIEDQFVPIGKPLDISILTTGKPRTVKWYKNGQVLSDETAKTIRMEKIDDNKYVLKIEKCTLNDSGIYSVEVENEAGQARSSGEIIVEDQLTFLKPLKDLTVVEGEQAEFVVETNIHPRTIKWYKNGQEVKAVRGKVEMKENATKFSLIISKAATSDAASYKVVLSNSTGDLHSSANLTVKEPKNQPKIIKGLVDQVIAKGDELILDVKVDGEPTEVRWLKNGTTLPRNTEAIIEQIDKQTYRLKIPNTDVVDGGVYSVEVINEVGKAQSSGKVEVDVRPEIVKGLKNSKIDEGDEQVFKVETNVPVRIVKWYKNGQEIKPSTRMTLKEISSKKFELIISKASLDDAAVYMVTLANRAGECDTSASLTVVKPDILKILEGLKDVDVDEGELIKLSVKIEGHPKVVKWLKNGQIINPDGRIKTEENPETGEYVLMISESVTSDGAAYRIVLSNDRGEVQSGSIAHVKGKKAEPVTSAAAFITPLEDLEISEGDTLTLKCKISGEPKPVVQWYKDGIELTKDDRIVMRTALDGTTTLRILDSKKEDSGSYSVTASNFSGQAKSECNVRILLPEELPSEPKFVIPLKDVFAVIGSQAEFSVKVRGVPKPTLSWFIGGKEIIDVSGIEIDDLGDGNWRLFIANATEEFFGHIKCVAINEWGKTDCESQLILMEPKLGKSKAEEGYPPKFNVPLWDRRIPLGQIMTIECHVDSRPTADIIWTKDGATLMESDRVEIRNTPDGACRVRINSFGESDIGTYKCTATNMYGVADTRSNLNIQAEAMEKVVTRKQYPPRFNPPLTDKFADVDETVRLVCKVDAVPKATITWYKDGVPLRDNGRVVIENDDDGNCLLTINHSTEYDDGAYRCVAVNEIGSTNSACMVSIRKLKDVVKKEGEEPFFTKGLVDKWLERGDELTLTCTVTGNPFPDIRWYRNGILLRPTNKIILENSPNGVCTLKIADCAMSDEGIYRCDAENCYGKVRTQSTVHIEKPLEKLEKKKVLEGEAPRFIRPLEDTTVYVDSSVDLECKVIGDPMPTVKWFKDGAALRDDLRYEWKIDANAGTYHLKIKNANSYDEGAYRCVATNAVGSATTKSFVRIDDGIFAHPPSFTEPPRFTIALGDARAIEGQPLKFECKIEGAPLTDLAWYKDGERIVADDRIKIESDSDGRIRLLINPCNVDDEGLYRVIVTNAAGTAHDKGAATVKKLPEDLAHDFIDGSKFDGYRAPRVIIPLESTKINEGNGFTLRCKFSGDPRPSIKWFKDGERVYSCEHCTLTETEDGICELKVKNANRFDAGGYRCVAENVYGSARTTCEVIVQLREKKPQRNFEDEVRDGNAPGFSVPLTMKRAKPGSTVILECVPYGKPFPEIKWLKDGMEIEISDRVLIESLNDKTQRIILKDIDFSTDGFYRCVATNEYGTASTKAEVIVEGDRTTLPKKNLDELSSDEPKGNKPRIRRGLYNMAVHQGNTIEMQVCTSGWPTPTVQWFKNGQELNSSGSDGPCVVWTDERGLHHCVILNAKPEDEGEYSLEATNEFGKARTEGAITIIRPREVPGYEDNRSRSGMAHPPGFIRQLKNKHVFSHMPAIFDCLVVGYPPPEVEWFHNGKKITPGGRIRIQSCGGGSHAIIIMDAVPEDSGEYVAVARNSQGQASSCAVLDVTAPHLDSIKFDGSVDVTPYLTEEYGFKKIPYHSLPTPPDRGPFIKEVTGHYLTLSWIPTKRTPPRYPQVTYVIEIRELPEKEWMLLDYNIPEPVCKVRNLELGKSYQFRVRAENIYGISDPSPASPPSRLMAPPQPALDKNKRVIPLLDPYVERALEQAYAERYACAPWFAPGVEEKRFCAENDTLSITLCVSGFPDPKIIWKFRGMDLETGPTSKTRVVTHGGTETTLTVNGFSRENVGQYQCIATNQYGEAQQNIYVDLGARPKFIQPLSNKTVSGNKPLRLDVRVEGNPFPEIKWMKEWRPIVESSRVSFIREEPYLCSLIINDPMWRDCGIYSATAINEAGTATTSCSVTVEAGDDFGETHGIRKKKARVVLEDRKVREIYEIDENDEKVAAAGAPFHVTERATGRRFLAQLRPLDENLARNIEMHNNVDHPCIIQFHQVIMDQGIAVLVYENANRSLLDLLITYPSGRKGYEVEEQQVQIIVRQLLYALKCMHDRKVAHLDIRPEVILLQDDQLRLADFSQSRRLIRGKIMANLSGSPEFVSPEIATGTPVTLASDLWSVGVLTYVLLSGISPFLGRNDTETVRNVILGNYTLDCKEFARISNEAKDFISKLLILEPTARLNVDEALRHPWLSKKFLENAPPILELLKEFKYKPKWLERRLFVQQSSLQQPMSGTQAPGLNVLGSPYPQDLTSNEPHNVCDYLPMKGNVPSYGDGGERLPKRRLQPQKKGETPSQQLLQHKQHQIPADFDEPMLPLQLVCGEHREIEEEIANRILSDISEETSTLGSLASIDELESPLKASDKQMRQKKSRSNSSTPQVEGFSPDGTPITSPVGTTESVENHFPEYHCNTDLYRSPEQLDSSVPVGAPLFLEGLQSHPLLFEEMLPSPQSPQSLRSLPGTKSPVLLSPRKEYSMEVVIGTKQDISHTAQWDHEIAKPLPQQNITEKESVKKIRETVQDDEFENFMNQIKEMKQKRKKEREEMEQLRPKKFYDEEIGFKRPDVDDDEVLWESHYQTGPETFLLATRGASFNARVRDYRRGLWGDGAPLVTQGYLGYRNQDISVRERRRFTDLIREDETIAKSVENLDRDMCGSRRGAIRRIRSDISKAVPVATREDGTFGAIFRNRLKDIALVQSDCTITFECAVIGNPQPTVEWFFNESLVVADSKHKIFFENGICQLTIQKTDMTDLGEYECVASNEHAVDRTSAHLYSGGTPTPTGRPEVEFSSDTEVFITWEAPRMSHALECFMYKLEVRPAGENDRFAEWRLVSDKIEDEAAIVRHLTPQGIYQFRVTAKNEFGWGVPSLTSRIIKTHPKNSRKLQIDQIQNQRRVCVVSKPPKTQLISKSKSLDEITEVDEEKIGGTIPSAQQKVVKLKSLEDLQNRFQLNASIPRGRFGKIVYATDALQECGTDCIVKIKDINAHDANGIIEFEALKACQQESIARLLAAYQKNEALFLFMERYQEDLFERFTYRDNYNEEQISRVVAQIVSALHWIHFKGYIHMDIQATNVLFVSRQSWQIKLIDFGSAQKIGSEIKRPSKPNLYWASPEILCTDDKQPAITVQNDMWGLGVIVFCLLSGFHPFAMEGDSDDEIRESILNQKCNLSLIQVQATQESLRFVTWALKKNPMRRMRTDEALMHRWLSTNAVMIRRREAVKYSSSRLQKTAVLTADFIKRHPDSFCQQPIL